MSALIKPLRRPPLLTTETIDRSRVLDTLASNLDGMAYRCLNDSRWTMVVVSQGVAQLTGYNPPEIIENTCVSWEEITHPSDRVRVRAAIDEALATGKRFVVEYRINTLAGETKWVCERGTGVLDETGRMVIEGFIEDITVRRQTIEALEHAELRYRHIFEHASEGIFQTTRDGRYLAANPSLAKLYGYATPAALMADLSDIAHQLYVDAERREIFRKQMAINGEVRNFESEVFRRDGKRLWISENAHIVRGPHGEFLCYEGTVQDITERKQYQAQLERQANHDQLTGLPNRNLLNDRITQGIVRANRLKQYLGLAFIDLDNFKFINDSLGHAAGDLLLVEVSTRLQNCLRGSDTVARLGGDEFVLVLNDHSRLESVISQLERILQEVGRPVVLAEREYQVGASVGVALYPDNGSDAPTLLKHADLAMYAAKDRGRNNFQFFTPELNKIANERLNLEAAMRLALERDEFEVHYQPKFDHTKTMVGVEALARWSSAEIGRVGPDRFIPIAEETGMILPLTKSILRQAFVAAREWNKQRSRALKVAVNLSARLFVSDDIVEDVNTLLRAADIPASLIELEITESVLLGDGERALRLLNDFKRLGFSLAMDDFGTGYSSLSYLRRLPVDVIKIDRSLVTGIEHDDDVAMIARAVISLGQSLRKTVVAEGVENQAQFDFLRYQGCHEFQGYLLSKPLPTEALTRLLADARH
jgi:diguanylate cyclase (GGDEF)-like protein/PAS domain S-box-containing protein